MKQIQHAVTRQNLEQFHQALHLAEQSIATGAHVLGAPVTPPEEGQSHEVPLDQLQVKTAALVSIIDSYRNRCRAAAQTLATIDRGLHSALASVLRQDPYMQAALEAEANGQLAEVRAEMKAEGEA